jgi:hypothetical protein
MRTQNRFLAITYSSVKSALHLYFEPLLWIVKGVHRGLAGSRVRKKGV